MKCRNLKKYFLSLFCLLLAFLGVWDLTYADYGQLDSSTRSASYSNGFSIDLGTGLTGEVASSSYYMSSNSHGSYPSHSLHQIACYDTSTSTNLTNACSSNIKDSSITQGMSKTLFSLDSPTLYGSSTLFTFDSSKYYKFQVGCNNCYVEGSTNPEPFYWGDSSYNPYYLIETNATSTPETPTHFDNISISTSTQTVTVTGYWNLISGDNFSTILEFYQDSAILGIESYLTVTATSTGDFSLTFPYLKLATIEGATSTANLVSSINFYANLIQIDSDYYDPFGSYNPLYKTTLDSITASLTAGDTVSSSTDVYFIGTTTRSIFAYPEYECGITSLTGCIKNAMIWLFYPNESSVNNYNQLKETMQKKAPFGYFYTINDNIKNITATGTPAFSLTIPSSIKTTIISPFDIGLASILWIFFLFNFYKRFKNIRI